MPEEGNARISQDREWCEVVVGSHRRRIRFHDYGQIYNIPGLYERLFYDRLKCCSPTRVVRLLTDVVSDLGIHPGSLKVLDLGAGNGMVGDELRSAGVNEIIGLDIIPEAKKAALRDRPGVYQDYLVADMTNMRPSDEETLRRQRCNCLSTVAALGFSDVPPAAFAAALSMIETPGLLAFNIKEDFLREEDSTGFTKLIRRLSREEILQIQAYRRYRHRLSMTGRPLYYVAMVARKLEEVPPRLLEFCH
jgi:predicted TPR repeat methyltransferase